MNNFTKSLLKILLVTGISIVLFIVGIPLIVEIQKHGFGDDFRVVMWAVLIGAILIDQIRRRLKK
jgi:predicted ABC-type exoprotein transport system permease subunit